MNEDVRVELGTKLAEAGFKPKVATKKQVEAALEAAHSFSIATGIPMEMTPADRIKLSRINEHKKRLRIMVRRTKPESERRRSFLGYRDTAEQYVLDVSVVDGEVWVREAYGLNFFGRHDSDRRPSQHHSSQALWEKADAAVKEMQAAVDAAGLGEKPDKSVVQVALLRHQIKELEYWSKRLFAISSSEFGEPRTFPAVNEVKVEAWKRHLKDIISDIDEQVVKMAKAIKWLEGE